MIVCGLKLTHDGAVAVIEDGRLRFSVEVEKLGNRPRYSELADLALVAEVLRGEGLAVSDVDRWAVDGWIRFTDGRLLVDVRADGEAHEVPVAGYHEDRDGFSDPTATVTGRLPLAGGAAYRSHLHAVGHVLGAYCTSSFAVERRPAFVLVWDGGMPARLYEVDARDGSVTAHGAVLDVTGSIYPVFASHLSPFPVRDRATPDEQLPISGKAMAYAALGTARREALDVLAELHPPGAPLRRRAAYAWSAQVVDRLTRAGLGEPDILASFQEFWWTRLRDGLREALAAAGARRPALCFSGGSALNIHWNARLRESELAVDLWVPPFPNDSGSALGAACAEMVAATGCTALAWDLFSGPALATGDAQPGWTARPASIADVARVLHVEGEPVVVLHGRAELGPRALGHRSVVAPAGDPATRDRLNAIKEREWYRPVAPVCLAERAPDLFTPGWRDPYMLYEQRVRPEWRARLGAVTHVDGTARVQTVDTGTNPLMAALLTAYDRLSGVPALCNTSANLPGRGFFPDVASALRWGRTPYVWADGTLYERDGAR